MFVVSSEDMIILLSYDSILILAAKVNKNKQSCKIFWYASLAKDFFSVGEIVFAILFVFLQPIMQDETRNMTIEEKVSNSA